MQPVRHELIRVLVQRVADVGIVPSVIARIDQHGIAQAKIAHHFDLVLDRTRRFPVSDSGCSGWRKGNFGSSRPYFQMGIDDQPFRFACQAGSGLCKKLAATELSLLGGFIGVPSVLTCYRTAEWRYTVRARAAGLLCRRSPQKTRGPALQKQGVIGTFHVVTTNL